MLGRFANARASRKALGNTQSLCALGVVDAEITALDAPAGHETLVAFAVDKLQRMNHARRVTKRNYQVIPEQPRTVGSDGFSCQIGMYRGCLGCGPGQACLLSRSGLAFGFLGFAFALHPFDFGTVGRRFRSRQFSAYVRQPALRFATTPVPGRTGENVVTMVNIPPCIIDARPVGREAIKLAIGLNGVWCGHP